MTIRELCTADDPDWLKIRHQYLTGTGVAKILMLDPYTSRKKYVEEKLQPEPPNFDDKRPLYMGRAHEEFNINLFAKTLGLSVSNHNGMFNNSKYPHLSATIDGYLDTDNISEEAYEKLALIMWDPEHARRQLQSIHAVGGKVLIEAKNTDSKLFCLEVEGPHGTYRDVYKRQSAKEIPVQYELQCQQQMLVTEIKHTLLLAKHGANGYMIFHVPNTIAGEQQVLQGQQAFVERVVNVRGK